MTGNGWLDTAPESVRQAYEWANDGDPQSMISIGGYVAGIGDLDGGLRWFTAAHHAGSMAAGHLLASLTAI